MMSAPREVFPWLLVIALALLAQIAPVALAAPIGQSGRPSGAEAELSLRLSDRLSLPPEARPTSSLTRDLLRLEQRTLQLLGRRDDDAQVLSEKLGWLEADLAELRRTEAHLAATARQLSVPGAGTGPGAPPVVSPSLPAESQPVNLASSAAAAQPSSSFATGSRVWLLCGGLAVLVAMLSLFFHRRWRPMASPSPAGRPLAARSALEAAASASMVPSRNLASTTFAAAGRTAASPRRTPV